MTPAQLKKVIRENGRFLNLTSRTDVTAGIQLVEGLLREETAFLKETQPKAVVSISEMECALRVIGDLWSSVENMDTGELAEEHVFD